MKVAYIKHILYRFSTVCGVLWSQASGHYIMVSRAQRVNQCQGPPAGKRRPCLTHTAVILQDVLLVTEKYILKIGPKCLVLLGPKCLRFEVSGYLSLSMLRIVFCPVLALVAQ